MTEQTEGKGRPTPKRSEAQKRRNAPVAPPPTSRREASRQLRAKQAEQRRRVREGSIRGDDSVLLKRDQGPVRRLVRELIDSRRSLGTILLPLAIVVLVSSFMSEQVAGMTFSIWLAAIAAVAVDWVFTGFALSRAIKAAFPDEPKWRGHIRYGLMRTTTIRRWRVPRPSTRA